MTIPVKQLVHSLVEELVLTESAARIFGVQSKQDTIVNQLALEMIAKFQVIQMELGGEISLLQTYENSPQIPDRIYKHALMVLCNVKSIRYETIYRENLLRGIVDDTSLTHSNNYKNQMILYRESVRKADGYDNSQASKAQKTRDDIAYLRGYLEEFPLQNPEACKNSGLEKLLDGLKADIACLKDDA